VDPESSLEEKSEDVSFPRRDTPQHTNPSWGVASSAAGATSIKMHQLLLQIQREGFLSDTHGYLISPENSPDINFLALFWLAATPSVTPKNILYEEIPLPDERAELNLIIIVYLIHRKAAWSPSLGRLE
jgi:hypothetical protein